MTTKRLRVLELLSSAVAVSACERTSRLLKPKAELKVTRKCFCPYCKDPTPYQTHKYKRLMHPERFNDSSDPNNDSQEVGESSGAVSDTPMATQNAYTVSLGGKNAYTISPGGKNAYTISPGGKNAYTISPGGKKAYTISPGGKNAYTPGGKNAYTMSPGGKNAYTTSPGGRKKKVIRIVRRKTRRPTGGENSVTVMSSNGKKLNPQELDCLIEQLQRQGAKNMTTDELVLIANALSVGATTSLKNTPTSMKRETLSPQGLLAADLIAPPFITDDSSDSSEQRKSQDTTTGHLLQVANHLTSNRSISSDLMTVDTPTKHADLKSNSHISTILSSEVTNGDGTLTPTTSTHGVSVDTITKSLEPKKTTRGSKSRRSSQTQSKGKIKSPSSRKAKMRVGAAPPLPTSDQVSNENLISPQGKKKSARRRSKGVMLSPSETDPLTLPPPPSRTEGTQTKKSLRSRLNNGDRSASPHPSHKSSSVSEHDSQCNKDKTPKSGRRRVRRVKELSVIPSPRPRRRSTTKPKQSSSTKSRPEQQSRISAVRTGDEKQKWEPLRRAPSRTQSLPIGQNQSALQEFTHEPTDPKGRRKRQLDKQKSLTRISGLGNDQKRVPPCRTQSLKDELRSPSKHDVVPSLKELMSTTKKGRQNVSKKSVYEPSGVSPKPSLQSPTLRQRSLSTQVRKKQIDPPLRRPQIRVNHALRDTSWIPSVISVESPEIPDDITDSISVVTQPIFPETPDSSKSLKQEHQATKNVSRSKSLDRFKVKLSRGRGRTQPKKEGEKESVDTSLQVESESNENATRQGPARVFKRSLSLDRLLIGRRILQVKDSKKDNSQDKKGKNSKPRNWLRRGSLK